ncbi:MAG: UDP-N-acetylglucosamine--N-acetylmuramyl-(pentapeptide) pyrophosphoryl-undecaprenol N-acetylglucosamine transferase [Methanosarcina sp.]
MKILMFVCGEGLGHTSRCLALGKEFQEKGHEVSFGTYGYSKILVEKTGYPVFEIPSEIKLRGTTGSFDLKQSIKETLKNTSFFCFKENLKILETVKPDVVLSDGYYNGIFAAQKKKIPVYFIGHQFNMIDFFQKQDFLVRTAGKFVKTFYNYVFSKVNGIIVPDYPPPYSINRKNFTLRKDINNCIVFSGPLIRRKYKEVNAKSFRYPNILSTIGAFGYRAAIFTNVLEAAKLNPNVYYTFICGPEINPEQFSKIPENVQFTGFIEDPFPYYKGSELVITAGGHGTILESLAFGLPVLSFPDQNHIEQENNATVLEEEGYGKKMNYKDTPEKILDSILEILNKKQKYEKTGKLRNLAEELDGPAVVRKLLESRIEKVL